MRQLFIFLFVEKEVGTERIGGENEFAECSLRVWRCDHLVTAGVAAGVRDLVQQMLHATSYALHAVFRFRRDGPGGARRMVLLGSTVVLWLPASRHVFGMPRFVRDAAHTGAVLLIEVNRCRVSTTTVYHNSIVTRHVITHTRTEVACAIRGV
jgi:hypothetical protein